jgi:sugar phosphate isomerase/epimerase
MPTLPIGIQTRSLRLPLRRALAVAAELGADGVEVDLRNELRAADFSQTALRELRKVLDDLGLRVLSAAFPTRRGFDQPEDLDRRLQATCEAMTFAYKLGARVVVGRAGSIPDAADDSASTPLVDALRVLGAHGERAGAQFAIATGAPPTAQLKLLDRLGEGTVGVALHPGLLLTAGHEPLEAATLLGHRMLAVAAVDAVREASVTGSRAAEVELGRGEADFPALLATLEEHGFRGPLVIERGDADDPAGAMSDAVAYLRALAG